MGTFSEVEVERLGMSTVCTVLSPEWLDVLCRGDSGGSLGPATHHLLTLDRPTHSAGSCSGKEWDKACFLTSQGEARSMPDFSCPDLVDSFFLTRANS